MALCTARQRAYLPRADDDESWAILERPCAAYNCARTPAARRAHVRFDNEKLSVNKENDSKRDKQHDVRYVRVAGSGHPTRPGRHGRGDNRHPECRGVRLVTAPSGLVVCTNAGFVYGTYGTA